MLEVLQHEQLVVSLLRQVLVTTRNRLQLLRTVFCLNLSLAGDVIDETKEKLAMEELLDQISDLTGCFAEHHAVHELQRWVLGQVVIVGEDLGFSFC